MLTTTKPNGLQLMMPWPDSLLNPNVKVHWAVKRDAKQASRDAGYLITLQKGVQLDPDKRYQVELVFCPPNNRTRDLDNLQASCKWMLDGIAQALGINDSQFRPVSDWGPLVERGKVEVSIKEIVKEEA